MASRYDYKTGDGTGNAYNTGDLVIANGDFAIGISDQQHIQDTLTAYKGWWKQYPADGVGLYSYINGSVNTQLLAQQIKVQLQLDGYKVSPLPEVAFIDRKLVVNPNATI